MNRKTIVKLKIKYELRKLCKCKVTSFIKFLNLNTVFYTLKKFSVFTDLVVLILQYFCFSKEYKKKQRK